MTLVEKFDWSKYYLADIPFLNPPIINVLAADQRVNGRLFCKDVVEEEFTRLVHLITRQPSMVYVSSSSSVLGTGKSALMAAAYWHLRDQGKTAIWVEATGGMTAAPTIGRVIDAMVAQGIFDQLTSSLGHFTYDTIVSRLKSVYPAPSPTLSQALTKILQTPQPDTAKKFANIRRSIQIASAAELFGYVTVLLEASGIIHPNIFLDQFEEFVQSHSGQAQMFRLGSDINDLLRGIGGRVTFVTSLHPEAESTLMSAAGKYVRTLAPISQSTTILVRPISEENAVKLASYYLNKYRVSTQGLPDLFPFSQNVIRYIASMSNGVPRSIITALHNALIEGALRGYAQINEEFIAKEDIHSAVLIDAPNKWRDFVQGSLKAK